MAQVNRALAERIAEAARLLEHDGKEDGKMRFSAGSPTWGGTRAGRRGGGLHHRRGRPGMTFAASDPRIDELHRLQFAAAEGPAIEALRHNEPRRVDDMAAESRWPVPRLRGDRFRRGLQR
jgi:hypothetical protein